MTSRENIERWVAELDEDGMCNISDNQVAALIRGYNYMAVQLANAESKCRELAAECAGMKAAFDKPQAYLSWHAIPPTWEDPLPCGEYLDVHDDAGHKNSDGTDCWPVYAKPEIETPETDSFLAEVRAQGVEMFAQSLHVSGKGKHLYSEIAEKFAAQLRKGVVL